MFSAVTAGVASFVFVFLKAFQQRNVAFDHYTWVIPTSMAMAFTEFYVIATIIKIGYDLLAVGLIGTGAGAGALLAMVIHKRFLGNGHPTTSTSITAQGSSEVRLFDTEEGRQSPEEKV